MKWEDMAYWKSGEYQVIEEILQDMELAGEKFNPPGDTVYTALRMCPLEDTRVIILGQDPYPNRLFCTGIAFSVPSSIDPRYFPLTLKTIFKEYTEDLGYPYPTSGDLTPWCKQGVLLWNCIPTCNPGVSLSHNWNEYIPLTKEILEILSKKGKLVVTLGSFSRNYLRYVDKESADVLSFAHPSPRGNLKSKTPFTGSRFFSTINNKLREQGQEAIEWRLP